MAKAYSKITQIFTVSLLTAILYSCFQLREPARPTVQTGWTSPTEPEILMTNFREAVAQLNIANYERSIVPEGFQFRPDPVISGQNPGVFARWTIQEELEYIKNIINQTQNTNNNSLQFTDTRQVFLSADSVEINTNYNLQILHADTSFSQFNFQGNAIFKLVRNSRNEWVFSTWQDNKTTQLPCWTELKRHFIAP